MDTLSATKKVVKRTVEKVEKPTHKHVCYVCKEKETTMDGTQEGCILCQRKLPGYVCRGCTPRTVVKCGCNQHRHGAYVLIAHNALGDFYAGGRSKGLVQQPLPPPPPPPSDEEFLALLGYRIPEGYKPPKWEDPNVDGGGSLHEARIMALDQLVPTVRPRKYSLDDLLSLPDRARMRVFRLLGVK